MESLTPSGSRDTANVDAFEKEPDGGVTQQRRKYVKRKAEDKIKFKPVSCDWNNILAQNKLVVSMSMDIFQQDVVIRQANAVFMRNFGFIDAAHATGAGVRRNSSGETSMEPCGAIGLPLRALIGDTPITMDLDERALEKWALPPECPTSSRVLADISHSVTTGANTSFFCTLVDSCNRPMFCHVQCVPIISNTHPSKAMRSETKPDHQSSFQSTQESVQNILWAVLTIHCASQIGCAMQFGIGYGLKTNQRYSEEVSRAFKRAHESNPKGAVMADTATNNAASPAETVGNTKETALSEPSSSGDLVEKLAENVISIDNPCPRNLHMFGMSS